MFSHLSEAVLTLGQEFQTYTDADLEQPWAWGPHREGIRFALLGTSHELRDLAVHLAQIRRQQGLPLTRMHHLLDQYHRAYRDLESIVAHLPETLFEEAPAAGEWPLRRTLAHIFNAERHFFTLVHYALRRHRSPDPMPAALPEAETEKVTGPNAEYEMLYEEAPISRLLAEYARLHQRALDEFSGVTDDELQATSLWWEGIEYNLHHRLHRFDAHLRQHTVQVEKTLVQLGHIPTEARRLLRLVYGSLSEVEGISIGAPALGSKARQEAAETILARTGAVRERVDQAHSVLAAITYGDPDALQELLSRTQELANARSQQGISAVLTAAYYRQPTAVAALRAAGASLSIHDAAAVGDLQEVQEWVKYVPLALNQFARDGFTPLQLACFFGQEEVASWLIAQGADVNAVAQNNMRIQSIHAAANFGSIEVVQALLERGADVNARQGNDYTPLHGAADNGNAALVTLLLDQGADPEARANDGKTARELAREKGHEPVVSLLLN